MNQEIDNDNNLEIECDSREVPLINSRQPNQEQNQDYNPTRDQQNTEISTQFQTETGQKTTLSVLALVNSITMFITIPTLWPALGSLSIIAKILAQYSLGNGLGMLLEDKMCSKVTCRGILITSAVIGLFGSIFLYISDKIFETPNFKIYYVLGVARCLQGIANGIFLVTQHKYTTKVLQIEQQPIFKNKLVLIFVFGFPISVFLAYLSKQILQHNEETNGLISISMFIIALFAVLTSFEEIPVNQNQVQARSNDTQNSLRLTENEISSLSAVGPDKAGIAINCLILTSYLNFLSILEIVLMPLLNDTSNTYTDTEHFKFDYSYITLFFIGITCFMANFMHREFLTSEVGNVIQCQIPKLSDRGFTIASLFMCIIGTFFLTNFSDHKQLSLMRIISGICITSMGFTIGLSTAANMYAKIIGNSNSQRMLSYTGLMISYVIIIRILSPIWNGYLLGTFGPFSVFIQSLLLFISAFTLTLIGKDYLKPHQSYLIEKQQRMVRRGPSTKELELLQSI